MANLYQRSEEPLNTRQQKNDFLDDQWCDLMRDWLACQQTWRLEGSPYTVCMKNKVRTSFKNLDGVVHGHCQGCRDGQNA